MQKRERRKVEENIKSVNNMWYSTDNIEKCLQEIYRNWEEEKWAKEKKERNVKK